MKHARVGGRSGQHRLTLPATLISGVVGVLVFSLSPVACAVQRAFDLPQGQGDGGNIPAMRMSAELQASRSAGKAVRFVDRSPALSLRSASSLQSLPDGQSVQSLGRLDPLTGATKQQGRSDRPLLLAQYIVPIQAGVKSPDFYDYSGVDLPMLRMSRVVGMPGGAGIGIPRQPIATPTFDVDGRFDEERAPPLSSRNLVAGESGQDADVGPRWRVPPIRWGGGLGYTLSKSWTDSGQGALSQGVSSNLNASSYIYAPWAVTVSGRLGWFTSLSSSDGSVGSGLQSSSDTQNSSITGGGEISVFPGSRFPFQAYLDRSDSRGSGNIVSNDYVSTRLGLRQNYRGVDGTTNFGGNFEHSTVTSSFGGNDTVTMASASYSNQLWDWRNGFSARYSLGERADTGERAKLISLGTTHSASFDDNLNLGANFAFTDNTLNGGSVQNSFGDTQTRFMQFNASGNWMPEFEELDDLPLSINGGIRFGTFSTQSNGLGMQSQNYGGNAGAMYRFSNNFSMAANGALSQFQTSGGQGVLVTLLGTTANYVGNPLTFGKYSYNWNTGANLNWQGSSGNIPSNFGLGGSLGHALSRFITLSDTDSLSVSLSQNLNTFYNQTGGTTSSVSHSVNAGYGLRLGEQYNGNVSATISDVNTIGENSQHYTAANLGMFGVGQLSNLSSANVNLQLNWSRQQAEQQFSGVPTTGATNDTSQRMTLMGTASYTHARFAGVRGLRYELLFTADTRLLDDRLLGNTNGAVERSRWTLTNRWNYRLGMLDFRTNLSFNDAGGRKNALLFFQVIRQLGAY